MWSETRNIQGLRERYTCAEFFTPHACVWEAFKVDDKQLRETIYRQVFFNVHFALAWWALETCVYHAFRLDEFFDAIGQLDRARETFTRYLNAKVHEIVKSTVCEATAQAFRSVD